jgi:hypothetical protein
MRLSNVAGPFAPLLVTCAAVAIGCATGVSQQDASGPPQVVAVYSIDTNLFVGATTAGPKAPLPDVLLYHQTDARVSDKAPASYDGLRIEFNQPLDPASVANQNSLGGTGSTVANASFCNPLTGDPTTNPVQILDVSGANGGAANNVIPTSVCYNPASDLGSNPSLIVQLGATALNSAAVAFTCQSFARPAVGGTNSNFASYVLNKPYALKLATTIKGSNGQALTPPTGGNPTGKWSGATFSYQSSGFEIMAAGYQDDNTGFFTWINKPFKGFMKDLDPVSASAYRQPPTNTGFVVITTLRVNRAGGAASDAAGNQAITVTKKKNGKDFPVFAFLSSTGDRREILVFPGEDGDANWEPGVEYVLKVDPAMTTTDKTLTIGGTGASYNFNTGTAPLALTLAVPSQGAISQPLIRDVGPANAALIGAAPVAYAGLVFQAGIDPATVNTTNVVLKDSTGATVSSAVVPGEDNSIGNPDAKQSIYLTPTANLKPGTTYTITTTNLKVDADVPDLAGQKFADSSTTFTTENFRIDKINAEGLLGTTPGGTPDILDVTRSTSQDPEAVVDGTLKVRFTDTPTASTVTASSLQLLEGSGASATPVANTTVTISGTTRGQGLTGSATITAPATYPLKFAQPYQIKAATSITGPGGVALKAEGCTTGDCSDLRTFTTRAFAPTLSIANIAGTTPGVLITLAFNYDVDSTTVAASNITLFRQGATRTPVTVTCSGTKPGGGTYGLQADKRSFQCGNASPLVDSSGQPDYNASYLASAIFTTAAKVANPTARRTGGGSFPADTTTGQFTGSRTATVTTRCKP